MIGKNKREFSHRRRHHISPLLEKSPCGTICLKFHINVNFCAENEDS